MEESPGVSLTQSKLRDGTPSDTLDFPLDLSFVSLPPKIPLQVEGRRIEENLSRRNQRSGGSERRRAEKISVEFGL